MNFDDIDPHIARITTYPIKSLDGIERERATVLANGGLDFDRTYALVDGDGRYVNGKNEAAIHRLRSTVDIDARTVRLTPPDAPSRTFSLPDGDAVPSGNADANTRADADSTPGEPTAEDGTTLTEWLSAYFEYEVRLRQDHEGGLPDDTTASGPTVISTATIEEVASWYPDVSPESMRRRLRANLELGGVPPFWEDNLFSDRDHVVPFEVGGVTFEGVNPCQRCVVPSRDPDTGEATEGFREQFVRRREETMPPWSGGDWFDHSFRLMVNTHVSAESVDSPVALGDGVVVGDPVPRTD